ncbi:MAG: ABC transporter ATP-binding protein, partial [Pseudomonadota bacterium]
VEDISISARAGEFVAVTGPSGSGKSSLLYLLGLLDVPTSGEVLLEGAPTAKANSRELAALRLAKIGFVFQFHFLLAEFSALDNILIPMRKLGRVNEAEASARARRLLEDLGVGEAPSKKPSQFSGGQRQRVAIARALANDPPLILADEPTGNLDSKNSETVCEIFGKLAREAGRTVIAVTHDLDFAAEADRRIHLIDGRIASDERQS